MECGRRFSRMSLLKAHRQTHIAENTAADTSSPSSPPSSTTLALRCSECGKRFSSATRLHSHIRTQHWAGPEVCSSVLDSRSAKHPIHQVLKLTNLLVNLFSLMLIFSETWLRRPENLLFSTSLDERRFRHEPKHICQSYNTEISSPIGIQQHCKSCENMADVWVLNDN